MQFLVDGLISGLTIALLALAFALVYLPTRVFHVALAAVYTAAPFVAWAGLRRGWAMPMAVTAALLSAVVLSLACEWLNHAPLQAKSAAFGTHMVASLGLYMVIVQAVVMVWGNETRVLRTGLDTVIRLGDTVITGAQAVAAVVAVGGLAAVYGWLRFTGAGLRLRALAENPTEFVLRGHSAVRARSMAFGLSGLLAASSALVTANDTSFTPEGGLTALLVGVVATVVGGRRSFAGATLGALVIGIARSAVAFHLSARWLEAMTFVLLAAVLFCRPHGILGGPTRVESAR